MTIAIFLAPPAPSLVLFVTLLLNNSVADPVAACMMASSCSSSLALTDVAIIVCVIVVLVIFADFLYSCAAKRRDNEISMRVAGTTPSDGQITSVVKKEVVQIQAVEVV